MKDLLAQCHLPLTLFFDIRYLFNIIFSKIL